MGYALAILATMTGGAVVGWHSRPTVWRRWLLRWWSLVALFAVIAGGAVLGAPAVGVAAALGLALAGLWWRRRAAPIDLVRDLRSDGRPALVLRAVQAVAAGLIGLLLVFVAAWVGSLLLLMRPPTEQPPIADAPAHHEAAFAAWGRELGRLAAYTEREVLRPLPVVGPTAGEMMAVHTLFQASPGELQEVAAQHGLERVVELESVRGAFDDPAYRRLIRRARGGDLQAIGNLIEHAHTHRMCGDQRFQDLVGELTPQELATTLARVRARRAATAVDGG